MEKKTCFKNKFLFKIQLFNFIIIGWYQCYKVQEFTQLAL